MEIHHYNKSKSIVVWLLNIYCLIFLLVAISMLLLVIYHHVLNTKVPIVMIVLMILICCIAIVYSLDILLWQIIGKEDLTITNNEICMHQYGRIFSNKRTVNIADITDISVRKYLKHGENNYWCPSKQGRIKIKYANRIIYIGRNIEILEAQNLVEIIENSRTIPPHIV